MTVLSFYPPPNELELLGTEMRAYALLDPCFIAADGLDPRFYRRIGEDISVSVCLELFNGPKKSLPPPRWHASISFLHEIGSGTDKTFGMPEQAMLITPHWGKSKLKQARETLGYLLGPVILYEKQVVQDVMDRMCLHWFTEALPETVGYAGSKEAN